MSDAKRFIGVATSARSDFGLLTPLIEALVDDFDFTLKLFATGMHFSKQHGNTIDEIRNKGFADCLVEIPCFPVDDTPEALAESMAAEISGFGKAFAKDKPDILVVMGDRYDILPAAMAALNFNIPIAHISGGEVTEGVIDDSIRHAITKMSHLHFPSHEDCKQRLVQLGEEPWRITVSGEPGLDGIDRLSFKTRAGIYEELGFAEDRPLTAFTFHPDTLNPAGSTDAIATVLDAADKIDSQIIFTYPNADAGSQPIIDAIKSFCSDRKHCRFHASLGRVRYYNLLKYVDCMVGNSSSGIIEAASFNLPVVNIGDRQKGRLISKNVISVALSSGAIAEAWKKALSDDFRQSLAGLKNPFCDGKTVESILSVLKSTPLDKTLITKRFIDIP
jgi:UDP-N-acetylglucosamine 2-epimerase (non-hydrolysing)